jgi:hypothetical protein
MKHTSRILLLMSNRKYFALANSESVALRAVVIIKASMSTEPYDVQF